MADACSGFGISSDVAMQAGEKINVSEIIRNGMNNKQYYFYHT